VSTTTDIEGDGVDAGGLSGGTVWC